MAMPDNPCRVDDCPRNAHSKGLCGTHYRRLKYEGSLHRKCGTCGDEIRTPGQAKYCGEDCRPRCKVDGCEAPYRSKDGYCARHKALVRRNGKPVGHHEWSPKSDRYKCKSCEAEYKSGEGVGRKFCSYRCMQLWNTYDGSIPSLDFDCAMCGEHIARNRWDTLAQRSDKRLCDRCRKSKHKRHRSSVGYLAKRDGTMCGICGERVDMKLRHPDRLSPSVDHILPVALGGSNEESNLQLSHLICNLTKQARADYRPA